MSKYSYAETDDRRGQPKDIREAPTGEFNDNSYASRQSNESVPVVGDQASVEDPIRPEEAGSDQQLSASLDQPYRTTEANIV
ncbi:hypothetical protein RRF57_006816 [Xylaria bambusicola]|uniref:Uncharacterized protein n=1 Tax=Xylaria bambusicola TaxID=326684 RepID=A0AAN7ZA19_9PEZI